MPTTLIDGYKVDHRRQYPENTQQIVSNLTARGTRRDEKTFSGKVVFFGLQYFIKEYLVKYWNEYFFSKPKEEVIQRFKRRIDNYLGPNNVGIEHIEALYKLQHLPIVIYALPEGTRYKLRIPSMFLTTTNDDFGWLTNYLETILSTSIWGPCTSATTAFEYKLILNKFAMETVGNTDFVPWQGHDFSFRGMFGLEAAKMSGGAHLTSFTGTDTIPAIDWLEEYYNADSDKELIGGSVAATEHSVSCSTILAYLTQLKLENPTLAEEDLMGLADIQYVLHLITKVYPTGIVSIVADSFDYWNTITKTAASLKGVITARDGKVVFRPDTGDPVKVVCGDPDSQDENERKGSVECLWDIFGGTITDKGYKQLDSHVGLIYGDSITLERATAICEQLKAKGFASTNVVFGIGSYTYQYVTRDTDQYAVKATYSRIAGVGQAIYKKPKTGDGMKNSAYGLVAVFKDADGELYLKDNATWSEAKNCEFVKVFEDGVVTKEYSLAEVRAKLATYL